MRKKILLTTTFFESPFHQNRAPYNEQLFLQLKNIYEIKIIRPIAWTDIVRSSKKKSKKKYYISEWNGIQIMYPTYKFIPKLSLRINGTLFHQSMYYAFKSMQFVPDLFYGSWVYPDSYAVMKLAKKLNKNYIIRVHGSDINILAQLKGIQGKIIKVLNNASAIISPSQALKNKMLDLGISSDKIHVLYTGIDRSIFKPLDKEMCRKKLGLSQIDKRIVYVGNFKKNKGVLDLLFALNKLQHDFNVEAIFIGLGEDQIKMERYISAHGLKESVRIVGPVDHRKIGLWINSSDCVCLPSYAEGLPNVLLESMACNKRIVATNVGGIPELIQKADSYLVKPGDIKGLAEKLKQALTDNDYMTLPAFKINSFEQMSEKISKLIEKFT